MPKRTISLAEIAKRIEAYDPVTELDELLDDLETNGWSDAFEEKLLSNGCLVHHALGLARAVNQLINFGGGNLRLPDGRVFKFARTCDACETAVRMFTRAGLESKFCVRCADDLARKEWARQKETP